MPQAYLYWSFDLRICLVSSFIIAISALYWRIYLGFFFLTIRCNNCKTLSLFYAKLHAFNTLSAFCQSCLESQPPTYCWSWGSPTLQLLLGPPLSVWASSAVIRWAFLHRGRPLKSPQPFLLLKRGSLISRFVYALYLFDLNTNYYHALLCLCVLGHWLSSCWFRIGVKHGWVVSTPDCCKAVPGSTPA